MDLLTLTAEGNSVKAQRVVDDDLTVLFRASNIRSQGTGIHALVEVGTPDRMLASDLFNIERDRGRVYLANRTHERLDGLQNQLYPKTLLKNDLDFFCREVWPTLMGGLQAESMSGDSFLSDYEFIAEPHVLAGSGTILFAPPGFGKSFTGLLMCVSVDAGVNDLWKVRQCRTLYVNLERSRQSITRRLSRINTALGQEPDRPLLVQNARGKSLSDIEDATRKSIEKHGVELVVVDSISRTGYGDLNENKPVNDLMDTLNSLEIAWVGLGHSPRADSNHAYGSVMFDAGADIVCRQLMEEQGEKLGVGIHVTKANDIPKQPIMVMAYEFDEWGLQFARKAKHKEFPELTTGLTTKLADQLRDYHRTERPSSTVTEAAEALGVNRTTVSRVYNADDRFTLLPGGSERAKRWGLKASVQT